MNKIETITQELQNNNFAVYEINTQIIDLNNDEKLEIQSSGLGENYFKHILRRTSGEIDFIYNALTISNDKVVYNCLDAILGYKFKQSEYSPIKEETQILIREKLFPYINQRLNSYLKENPLKLQYAKSIFSSLINNVDHYGDAICLTLIKEQNLTLIDFEPDVLKQYYNGLFDHIQNISEHTKDKILQTSFINTTLKNYVNGNFYQKVLELCLKDKKIFETFFDLSKLDPIKNQFNIPPHLLDKINTPLITENYSKSLKPLQDFSYAKEQFLKELLTEFNTTFLVQSRHKTAIKTQYNAVTYSVLNNNNSLAYDLNKKYDIPFNGYFPEYKNTLTYKKNPIGRPSFNTDTFVLPHSLNLIIQKDKEKAKDFIQKIDFNQFDLNSADSESYNFLHTCLNNEFSYGLDLIYEKMRKENSNIDIQILNKRSTFLAARNNEVQLNFLDRLVALNFEPKYFKNFLELFLSNSSAMDISKYNYHQANIYSYHPSLMAIANNLNKEINIENNFKYLDVLLNNYPEHNTKIKEELISLLSLECINKTFISEISKKNLNPKKSEQNLLFQLLKNKLNSRNTLLETSLDLISKLDLIYSHYKLQKIDYSFLFKDELNFIKNENIFSRGLENHPQLFEVILKDIVKDKNNYFLNKAMLSQTSGNRQAPNTEKLPLSIFINQKKIAFKAIGDIALKFCLPNSNTPINDLTKVKPNDLIKLIKKDESTLGQHHRFLQEFENLILMLDNGADLNRPATELNPFFTLIDNQNLDLLKILEHYKPDFQQTYITPEQKSLTAISYAWEAEMINYLVDEKNINFTENDQDKILSEIKDLIDSKDINEQQWNLSYKIIKLASLMDKVKNYHDEDNNNLLHLAMQANNLPVVYILIKAGIDINAVNKQNKTPFHYILGKALFYENFIKIAPNSLIKTHDSIVKQTIFGQKNEINFSQIVQTAFNYGASLNIKAKGGLTPDKLFNGKLKDWIAKQDPILQAALLKRNTENTTPQAKKRMML